MKKKLLIISTLLFIVIVGAVISASFLIESQKVQEQILSRLNSWYVVDARVGNIRFSWFPFPHVKLEQIEVYHQDFSVTSPQATLYPSWKILLGFFSMGRLDIIDPVFELLQISPDDKAVVETAINVPDIKLHIKNGTLLLPEQQNTLVASQKISLKNITASLAVHNKKGKFTWQSDASFAKNIAFSGEFGLKGYETAIIGEVNEFEAQKVITPSETNILNPLEDSSTFSFLIKKERQGINISIQGEIPDFSLSRLATTEDFRLGKGDFNLYLGPENAFSLTINDLLVHEPQVQIMGELGRHFPSAKEQANIKIDLKAKDIDLTAVRQKVLSLVGDNPVAQTVSDIVKGGKAHSASYFFDAPVQSFADVTAMTIKVDIAEADIHLAHIPLDLKNAQGPILIKDGDLTGKDITTWVGDAKGTDGIFLVGLAHDKHGLQVDVDIDANLEELPTVLRTLLTHKDVVHELGMVQGRGRANGHLHIGEDLRNFIVTVDVDTYQDAELRYERLSWPLHPESGNLQVTDTSVTWTNIKAQMGSHSILECSGHVNWDDPTIPLSLSSLHGLFDANTFLGELQQYPSLNKELRGVVSSIQGSVELTGTLDGPFFTPTEYRYSFDTKLKDITFKTPVLPGKVLVERAQGTISHKDIEIVSSSGALFDQEIHASGELNHDHWHKWRGNLELNGVLGSKHFSWLTAKNAFPKLLAPRPLYRAPSLHIRWNDHLFGLTATLQSGDGSTTLDLDILNENDSFTGIFEVKNEVDQASFSLQLPDGGETFTSSFLGNMSGATLRALLDDTNASFDNIHGDFKVYKTKNKKNKKTSLDFKGNLLARNIRWTWGKENRVVTIPKVNLASKGTLLKIKELETAFNNESLKATGSFSSKPGSGHLELEVRTPTSLTTTNIEKFQDDLDHFLYTTLAIKRSPEKTSNYEFSGLLKFNLNGLVLPFGNQSKNGETPQPYNLPFTPLKGVYTFNKTDSQLNLQDSAVCGVRVDGQLTWHGPKETSKQLSLMTPGDKPIAFKEFLACFNFDGIVEGPLTISGRIESDTEICKLGGLLITSKKGTIKKFVALAKALSLINITGLSGAIWKEGFYYNALEISGNICDNIFTIDKFFIDGDGVDVVATGTINLSTMEYDVTFFVVPFATINGLVTKVPLVGRVLGGKEGRIVSVPVKVTGPLHDPNVTVLSPSAIGEATGKWILETITLPFGWMIPEGSDKGENNRPDQISNQPAPGIVSESPGAPVQEQKNVR